MARPLNRFKPDRFTHFVELFQPTQEDWETFFSAIEELSPSERKHVFDGYYDCPYEV